MGDATALEAGRAALERRQWDVAYQRLAEAAEVEALAAEDLERLAMAAQLTGHDGESASALIAAHQAFLGRGEAAAAARAAIQLGFQILDTGQIAPAQGWLARAGRVLDESGLDCAERGYLLIPVALRNVAEGDLGTAEATFERIGEIGRRFEDPDLIALSRLGRGRALANQGHVQAGVALLDEAMASVAAGEVSPIVAGVIYCAVIEACQEMMDLRRAREWTGELDRWTGSQPGLVPYRGACLVYRAEILRLKGAWPDSLREAEAALGWLSDSPSGNAGEACYLVGEVHRVRGEHPEAEAGYRRASALGRQPQPGLALLRLAQGNLKAAVAGVRGALEGARLQPERTRLLPACVDILLAAGDVTGAREAGEELSDLAGRLGVPFARGFAAYARASVALRAGDARTGLALARDAWRSFADLGVPYEAARARLLVGRCCQELGDDDSAELELEAALAAFQSLGAAPDVEAARSFAGGASGPRPEGLTPRELEVLRLIAAGKTNRQIAAELTLSEKTIARHVSNIFARLSLPSRAAATAYAYEHGLVPHSSA